MTPEPAPPPRRYGNLPLYRRLLAEAGAYRLHFVGLVLIQLLAAPVALLLPVPLQVTVDCVLDGAPVPPSLTWILPEAWQSPQVLLWVMAASLVLFVVLLQIQDMYAWLARTWVGERLVLDLRAKVLHHLQSLSLTYHDARNTAQSVYRIQMDASSIDAVVVQGLLRVLSALAKVIIVVYVAARIDFVLVVVALVAGPLVFLLTHVFSRRLRRRWTEVRERESDAMTVAQESLSAVRVVKAFGQEERERHRYLDRARAFVDAAMKAVYSHGGFEILVALVMGGAAAGVLYVGARHVQDGVLSLGQLLLVVGYLAQMAEPLREVGTKMAELQRAMAGAERTFRLLDETPETAERPDARPLRRARGEVAFEGMAFGYDPERPVLRDVTLRVPAGARVGIAGRSGGGKSTLLSLLPRFYDPTAGRITLDGVDLRDYRLRDLREQFAVVPQEVLLFSTTVAENIAYGRPKATQEQIVAAAHAANAHDFVTAAPRGYDTEVGERGVRLSGGERQRIAIARAFLKDAPILILDEPTSALDRGSESAVMEALERLMRGRTVFLIAHRPSTLEGCDVRLEVRDGRVVPRGEDISGVVFDDAAPEG